MEVNSVVTKTVSSLTDRYLSPQPPQSPQDFEPPQDDALSVANSEGTTITTASTRRRRRRAEKGNQKCYKCRRSSHATKEYPEKLHNKLSQPKEEVPLDTFLTEV